METPSQVEAMETTTKNIKVDVEEVKISKAHNLPMHAKLAHILAVLVSGVIAVAVATVLADGTSVIKLKDAAFLKPITNPALKAKGINHRADQLLGSTYGIGLHHDQSGHSWTSVSAGSNLPTLIKNLGLEVIVAALPSVISTDDLKHPVPFLACDHLQMAGLAAMWLGFIAEAVAVVMVIFHSLMLAGMLPAKEGKMFAGLIWLVLTAGFLIVCMLAIGIYYGTWTCNQNIVPTLKIHENFDWNYGGLFAIIGFVSSLLILNVVTVVTSTKDGESNQPAPTKVVSRMLTGIVIGLFVGLAGCVAVAGGVGGMNAPAPVDPNVNPCKDTKPYDLGPGDQYFKNTKCFQDSVTQTLEQAGANVTKGYKGKLNAGDRIPITVPYTETDLCPVNVHWHLGAEHLSVGQFDEHGKGPSHRRQLAAGARLGYQCRHYNAADPKFTKPYNWKTCTNMEVGQTYEVHWPHSAAGACGTPWQYQSPFYDGVFCNEGAITIAPLNTYKKIGVQSQVFTIVNDEKYYNPDLIKGMIVSGDKGADMAIYTGSTTGTSRDNNMCSRFTPITWQVDRKCHLISASSFDKMCADMKAMKDDMSMDFYPHGARELVDSKFVANNQQS